MQACKQARLTVVETGLLGFCPSIFRIAHQQNASEGWRAVEMLERSAMRRCDVRDVLSGLGGTVCVDR